MKKSKEHKILDKLDKILENPNESIKSQPNRKHKFLDKLLENCDIDESIGQFYCKKCKSLVHIDWHRNLAFCGSHIISLSGITYIEELYNIKL